MLQKSGRLVLWEAMFILELHSAETQEKSNVHSFFTRYRNADRINMLQSYYSKKGI